MLNTKLIALTAGLTTGLIATGSLALGADPDHSSLPIVEVTADNVRIDQSCQLMVPRGTRITDADGNGVVHIIADNVVVTMAEGSDWLTGTGWGMAPDKRTGAAIRIEGHSGVTLSGLMARGFAAGIVTSDTSELVIEDCEIRDGFGSGIGVLGQANSSDHAGTAIVLNDAIGPTVRSTRIRAFERGITGNGAASLRAYDNDISYLSRAGIELSDSGDVQIARNTFDGIFGGAGIEVAAVRLTGASDRAMIARNAIRNLGPDGTGIVLDSGLGDVLVMRNSMKSLGRGLVASRLADSVIATNAADEVEGWAFDVSGERVMLAMNAVNESTGGVLVSGEGMTVREQIIRNTSTAIEVAGGSALVAKNAASVCETGLAVSAGNVQMGANSMDECETEIDVAEGATAEEVVVTMEVYSAPEVEIPGESDPTGTEPKVNSSAPIVGDFFPWDGEGVSLRTVSRDGKRHVFEVYGGSENLWASLRSNQASLEWDEAASPNDPVRFAVNGPSGVHPYEVRIAENGKLDRRISGTLLRARWRVDAFEWETDPAADREAWKTEADGKRGRRARTTAIQLDFGDEGPSELSLSGSVIRAKLRHDNFGILAASKLPLTPGKYEFVAKIGPDDEVRLLFDGKVVAEAKTGKGDGSGTARSVIEIDEPRDIEVEVEYVERGGPAMLELSINLLSGAGGPQD